MRWVSLLLLLSVSCAREGIPDARLASEDAWRSFREGKLDVAGEKATRNLKTCEASHGDCYWDFRLLEIEVLYARRKSQDRHFQPWKETGTPPDLVMKARYGITHAKIVSALGDYPGAHALLAESRHCWRMRRHLPAHGGRVVKDRQLHSRI